MFSPALFWDFLKEKVNLFIYLIPSEINFLLRSFVFIKVIWEDKANIQYMYVCMYVSICIYDYLFKRLNSQIKQNKYFLWTE